MSKNGLIKQENGSIAIYAIATVLSFILILGGVFFTSSIVRKNQLRTLLKIKEIYAQDTEQISRIEDNRKKADTSNYIKDGLVVFYDAINNMGSSHSNNTKIWRDLSSNRNDAIYKGTGELTWNSNAYEFSNPNTDYFQSKNDINLNTKSRTIELVYSLEEDGVKNLVGFGEQAYGKMNDILIFNKGMNLHVHGNNPNEGISADEEPLLGKMYSSTITYNYINNRSTTNYYTNGESKTNVALGWQQQLNTTATKLNIGNGMYTPHNSNKRFKLYSLRIYDRILTDEERKLNYEIDQERYEIIQNEYKFAYTGKAEEWVVPTTGKYKLEVWGAQGGGTQTAGGGGGNPKYGGMGGYSTGNINLNEGTKIYVYAGGQGLEDNYSNSGVTRTTLGGFNGGGSTITQGAAGSGGGASDIRIMTDSLYARVIVAGGGRSELVGVVRDLQEEEHMVSVKVETQLMQ